MGLSWIEGDDFYISPSALRCWEKNPEEWVQKYIAGRKLEQNLPMAVGTCFDAQVKAKLERELGLDSQSSAEKWYAGSLTITGKEKDQAIRDGARCLAAYEALGNYNTLMWFIKSGRWEVNADGKRTKKLSVDAGVDVTVHGRPDLILVRIGLESGECEGVILDWKVNGYYSNSGVSVGPGWVRKVSSAPKSVSQKGRAEYVVDMFGLQTSTSVPSDSEWSDQLGIYGHTWGWHRRVDSNDARGLGCNWMGWIEQLAWRDGEVTIASHRYKLTPAAMDQILKRLYLMWDAIKIRKRPLINLGLTEAEEKKRLEALSLKDDGNQMIDLNSLDNIPVGPAQKPTLQKVMETSKEDMSNTGVSFPWS